MPFQVLIDCSLTVFCFNGILLKFITIPYNLNSYYIPFMIFSGVNFGILYLFIFAFVPFGLFVFVSNTPFVPFHIFPLMISVYVNVFLKTIFNDTDQPISCYVF